MLETCLLLPTILVSARKDNPASLISHAFKIKTSSLKPRATCSHIKGKKLHANLPKTLNYEKTMNCN